MSGFKKDGVLYEPPVSETQHFYRVPYLVMQRSVAEAMPYEWQKKFIALLDEVVEAHMKHDLPGVTTYLVRARGERGKFVHDPLANYRDPCDEVRSLARASAKLPFEPTDRLGKPLTSD